MDPADNSFEGIAQGTLDWINDTFTLFHSDLDASSSRFDENYDPAQSHQAAKLSTEQSTSGSMHHNAYPAYNLDTSFAFDHDVRQRSQVDETAGPNEQPSFGQGTNARSSAIQRQRESSRWSFQLPSSIPPTPSSTTPATSADAYQHHQDALLPFSIGHTTSPSPNERPNFYSQRTEYPSKLSEPQSAASYGTGPYMLPTPALTSQESSSSHRSPSNQFSTSRRPSVRSAEPLKHNESDLVNRRRLDARRTAFTTTSHRNRSVPNSPLNPHPPPSLVREPITWPSVDADERQIETQPVPHQAPPPQEALYASSMQAPFTATAPAPAPATTLLPNPAPIRIKTEPPDRSSLQSVFHSSPALTMPARVQALEKNRLAARKSRTKKRDYIEDLAIQSRHYTVENKRLRSKVGELRDEATNLRDTIRLHKDCGGWTGQMQRGVEDYLRRVDERQEEEDRQQSQLLRGLKEEELDLDIDLDVMMEELGEE